MLSVNSIIVVDGITQTNTNYATKPSTLIFFNWVHHD